MRALALAAASYDGIGPLNDDALFALQPVSGRPSRPVTHFLARGADGELAGYAQLDLSHTSQLVVAPDHRRQGVG
ncbi:MAG: GNAT family N-acetyltransferase, partial [Propionibacteriaceae bacterium]|nr:GNAT family N-acetyltransferase [Propionibacteriaceae bacterium]